MDPTLASMAQSWPKLLSFPLQWLPLASALLLFFCAPCPVPLTLLPTTQWFTHIFQFLLHSLQLHLLPRPTAIQALALLYLKARWCHHLHPVSPDLTCHPHKMIAVLNTRVCPWLCRACRSSTLCHQHTCLYFSLCPCVHETRWTWAIYCSWHTLCFPSVIFVSFPECTPFRPNLCSRTGVGGSPSSHCPGSSQLERTSPSYDPKHTPSQHLMKLFILWWLNVSAFVSWWTRTLGYNSLKDSQLQLISCLVHNRYIFFSLF